MLVVNTSYGSCPYESQILGHRHCDSEKHWGISEWLKRQWNNQLSLGLSTCQDFPWLRPHTISLNAHIYFRLMFLCTVVWGCRRHRAFAQSFSPAWGIWPSRAYLGEEGGWAVLLMAPPFQLQKWHSAIVGGCEVHSIVRCYSAIPCKPALW